MGCIGSFLIQAAAQILSVNKLPPQAPFCTHKTKQKGKKKKEMPTIFQLLAFCSCWKAAG